MIASPPDAPYWLCCDTDPNAAYVVGLDCVPGESLFFFPFLIVFSSFQTRDGEERRGLFLFRYIFECGFEEIDTDAKNFSICSHYIRSMLCAPPGSVLFKIWPNDPGKTVIFP